MKRGGHRRISRGVASGVIAASIILMGAIAACSNGGEGARCEMANGNSDCQSGLVCMPGKQAAPGWTQADWCCPPSSARSTATAAPCVQGQGTVIGADDDAAPPQTMPDTSVPEASTDADASDGT